MCYSEVRNKTMQHRPLQEVMTHRVPEGPLQKEAPLAKVGDAVAVLLACITAGRKKQCSCSNLHRQVPLRCRLRGYAV